MTECSLGDPKPDIFCLCSGLVVLFCILQSFRMDSASLVVPTETGVSYLEFLFYSELCLSPSGHLCV